MEAAVHKDLSQAKRRLLQQRMRGTAGSVRSEPIRSRPAEAAVPLSPEQRRVWLHASQHPELPLYNESVTVYRHGGFDLDLFEASLHEILRRHEIWRTSFSSDGEALIHDAVRVNLPFVDLSVLPPSEREAEAVRLATADAQSPLPLDRLPLFRARVVRMSAEEHRLYLTLHHIIFDGLSLSRVFLPELSTIYSSFEQGKPSPVPPPALQYADYAVWREQHMSSPELKHHLAYWSERLSGELPVLHLPTDRPQPSIASHRGSAESFHVPADLLEKLRVFCRAQRVTLYMALLAVFKVLLFRYSGQNDLIVGGVADGRRRTECEPLMGYFLDTFAVRTRPTSGLRFLDYLSETREAVLGALVAADVPFDRVVREINPQRDARHHPIFQAFFNIRPSVRTAVDGWNLETMNVKPQTSKFILDLELCELPDRMEACFLYSTDHWEAATVRRMAGHWLALLESICRDPETTLGHLKILTSEETAALSQAGGWNDTARAFPQATVQSLIEGQVRRAPHAVAASLGDKRWTYQQLDSRAAVLASQLRAAGVTRGSIVAVALDRSLDMLAGLIAVLKTGAAYLPIEVDMPRERIAHYLADAKPSAILTESAVRERIPTENIVVVSVDAEKPALAAITATARPEEPGSDPNDTAYVIYTSGTTGEPKPVEVSQRSLVNLLASMQQAPGFGSDDVLLAVTPISFDIAALELFLPLISGGMVVIAGRDEARDPSLLAKSITCSGCTVMQATPATWRLLLLSGWKDLRQSKIRRLFCGGETLSVGLAHRLMSTGAEVWNMYGPTETTVWSLIHRVQAGNGEAGGVPIGRPIANTTAYILDTNRQPVPIGIPGELFLGGMGLAKGYRGRPEQTAERFVQIDALDGILLYRTGDLAVRKSDGTIDALGRADNQVKVRGHRIELESIEAAVLRHPDVAAAGARAWPESTGDSRLSVYVVARAGAATPGLADLRAFLRRSIPDIMIPSDVIPLPALPLTPHGKLDRSRLPAPTARVDQLQHAGPRSHDQECLCQIWGDVLGWKNVGLDDNFFDLGGHSLLVAVLQQHIASEFGQRIPITELFHNPTVRQQSELLLKRAQTAPALPPGVLALHPHGTGSGIFWIHYLNQNLVREMGEDQPFFVVSLTAEDATRAGKTPSLESLAACHMQKILATQPEGPYVIGGQCAGGVLAYEVAKQLTDSGKKVQLLVLLDVPNPACLQSASSTNSLAYRYCRYLARRVAKVGVRTSYKYIHEVVRNRIAGILRTKSARTEMRVAQELIEAAATLYRPENYDGSVLLVLSSDHAPHRDMLPGWQAVVSPGLHVQYMDGHHRELDTKNAPSIADAILLLISPAGQCSWSCSTEVSAQPPQDQTGRVA